MKILGGEFGGRTLKTPKGNVTRPTTSLVRKALFDICQSVIEEAVFLDLFSGSGALGIEALSRGAKHVTFIEKDKTALRCLEENIAAFKIKNRCMLLTGDVFRYLPSLKSSYDLITADPPYHDNALLKLLHAIETHHLITPGGFFFFEAPHSTIPLPPTSLHVFPQRRYGSTILHQFQRI